jgi:hypothetical protein
MLARACLGLAVAAWGVGCEPPVTVADTTTSRGGVAYVVGCEESPRYCKEKARELCPFGETTLDPGVGGWYSEGEDYRRGRPTRRRDEIYKLQNWIIRCNQPFAGG